MAEAIRYNSPDPVLVLPFACRNGTGTVDVHYGITADPVAVGLDMVAQAFDEPRFRGFPVIRAEINFDQAGYKAVFGWLQVITIQAAATGETTSEVDLPPMLAETDSPLAAFGYLPTMFDAPANPDHPEGQWSAETFLVIAPDIARTRRLIALTGFRWGYQLAAGKPAPSPVSPAGPHRWRAHRPVLAKTYQNWSFLDSDW